MVINSDHKQGTGDCSKSATSLAACKGPPQIGIHPSCHTCLVLLSVCQKLVRFATVFGIFIFLVRKIFNIALYEAALCDTHIIGRDHIDAVQKKGFLDFLEGLQIGNNYEVVVAKLTTPYISCKI